MNMKLHIAAATIAAALALPALASAKIKTESVTYSEGGTELEGFLAYDDAVQGKRPGILVVHDWDGLGDYEKSRCEQLAKLGYFAFAADIYGKGVHPKTFEENAALAGKYKSDLPLYRKRLAAGLAQLKSFDQTDPAKTAAIGYCFGGTGVLELARSGAGTLGVAPFHGGLGTTAPARTGELKAKVIVFHGAADTFVPESEVAAFRKEMTEAGADWQIVYFSDAVHAFTVPGAGSDPSKGIAYNANADQRSWEYLKVFFNELFK